MFSCKVHGFEHHTYNKISTIIKKYENILMKFTIAGMKHYGRLKSTVTVNSVYYWAFEMMTACPSGLNIQDYSIFTCMDKKGVFVTENGLKCCQITSIHETLEVLSNKMVDEDSVCCVNSTAKLTQMPSLIIGAKCTLPNAHFKSHVGVCLWMGMINGIECIGAEMSDWVSNSCNGYCHGMKVFDCRNGHGMLLRASDITIDNGDEIELDKYGFMDLKKVYHAKMGVIKEKEMLQFGRRAKLFYRENDSLSGWCYKNIFGVLKWFGTANRSSCMGIELDYPCKGGMDGIINSYETFNCESECGAVCPVDSVAFDVYCYSLSFIVEEGFNIDCRFSFKEDWGQIIVKERNLRLNKDIYVHVEKNDRKLSLKGTIKWCGYINGVSVAILEMDDTSPITPQQRILEILNIGTPTSYIIVHTQFLFNYRSLKSYEIMDKDLSSFHLENDSDIGLFRWRGADPNDDIYYGFEKEMPTQNGSDGTFYGQKLFDCKSGCGVLIKLQDLNDSTESKKYGNQSDLSDDADSDQDSMDTSKKLISLYSSIMDENGIPLEEVISSAMTLEDPSILGVIADNMTSSFDISEHPEILNQLVTLGSFKSLSTLIGKCATDDSNNKIFLRVAYEFLKNKKYKYFDRCMDKCSDIDAWLDNGETFVTQMIKEGVDQKRILAAIKDHEFDLSKPNRKNEVPLTLACSNKMTDVIDVITKYNKSQDARLKICLICMDRQIDTVFNCGHNSCKQCASNIDFCPVCKVDIKSRGKLFFS